jgi:type II secretory ATPase GspE/PulE/Tfp pilus assembly ATPase PilB-like protein
MENPFRERLQQSLIEGDVPKAVLFIFTMALNMGTSDIHIEPREHTVLIRFRIDGSLQEIIEYPSSIHSSVMSRLKILANLKIDEQRKPQDGRIQVTTEDRKKLELRVSTLPTLYGEKICMRLQDKDKSIPELDGLGIRWKNHEAMMKTIKNPNGIVLVTGPTGSGKTTTLYSSLALLNTPEINIMTIEDPVEYEMEGLSQSQVYPEIGYDFSSGLRTALRQDPDIIMVGEIRDQETIEIAIKAALTGHMVISTIHTNSAVATITRILDMGVKPYKITSALKTIEAQRLVKKLCPHCKEAYTPDEKMKKDMFHELKHIPFNEIDFDINLLKNPKLYHAKGCEQCNNRGYAGRMGVYEVMRMTREIEELILNGALEAEIQDFAIKHQGMMTLTQDAYLKALMGETSIEEVLKLMS